MGQENPKNSVLWAKKSGEIWWYEEPGETEVSRQAH